MALTIRNEEHIKYSSGRTVVRAEIDVDTAAELPAVTGISGKKLHQGSTALIITEGKLVILTGNGKWVDCSGNIVKE